MSDDTLFDSLNASYVQALYEEFARNPEAVPEEWRRFFAEGAERARDAGLLVPESLSGNGGRTAQVRYVEVPAPTATSSTTPPPPSTSPVSSTPAAPDATLLSVVARAAALVQAFREHGHLWASVDPLGSDPPGHPELDPSFFGMSMEELTGVPTSVILPGGSEAPLDQTLSHLREVFSGSLGYQFEHLDDPERVSWLWDQVLSGAHLPSMTDGQKLDLLDRLSQVEGLEQFLHRAYLGQKRFSIEGTDMLVPMLDQAIVDAAHGGAQRVVIGMAHRGRLNVLAHTIGVSYDDILQEFEGRKVRHGPLSVPDPGTGDVKYHHGAEGDFELADGSSVRVVLAPNPSHLEFVNPVVQGMARRNQFLGHRQDAPRDTSRVLPVLIHGDAAFAAEGVVAESLNMARLPGYEVGGSIHVIVNNQVGFTTDPSDARSTRYASDLAKGYGIPVVHVNADDPEACLGAVRLALAYRARFRDDLVIDLIGYRRHGHNEGDEPGYTQPRLYEKIGSHRTVRSKWAERLIAEGVLTEEEAGKRFEKALDVLRSAQDRVRSHDEVGEDLYPEFGSVESNEEPATTVDAARLIDLNALTLAVPEGFAIHPKLLRQLERRMRDFGPGSRLEWAHAEALAFASLLEEGIPVRLTGQDAERGTFSHRHLVLHDHRTGEEHAPLRNLGQARFEVYNSPLTEAAVIGFEYGYGVAAGKDLVMWEAQFGDFVNVGQVMIDQFLAAGWTKWGQRSRLTLLLPHGFEGQGPEHSSARLERFLQLCAEDNMRVVYPTTPAQYFHLIRRQALGNPERPLVVMTPKSLLRHPMATSTLTELAEGSFRDVLDDPTVDPERRGEIRRLVVCTGKIYYDLQGHPHRERAERVAVLRIEKLYPFPVEALTRTLEEYPGAQEVIWAQEEPGNMGALTYIGPRLRAVVPRKVHLRYVARPERASPAEGKASDHAREQNRIVEEALGAGDDE